MLNNSKYTLFIEKLIMDTPYFMIVNESDETYLLFDRFVMGLSDKAMPWLFKVYLEEQYNILKNDKFTMSFREKYRSFELNIVNKDGNLFFNKDGMLSIIIELEELNQIKYNTENLIFELL
ncbi:MAG: hypothetical protein RRZ84_06165 [Romboutsia sp.]